MVPDWTADYVGLPFRAHGRDSDGVDCWGLVRLVLAKRFGLRLPSYAGGYGSTEDAEDIGRLIRGEIGPWCPVPPGQEQAGDVVLMRLLNQPMHVGVVVATNWMLHIEDGIDACLERYDRQRWCQRVMGIYRYVG